MYCLSTVRDSGLAGGKLCLLRHLLTGIPSPLIGRITQNSIRTSRMVSSTDRTKAARPLSILITYINGSSHSLVFIVCWCKSITLICSCSRDLWHLSFENDRETFARTRPNGDTGKYMEVVSLVGFPTTYWHGFGVETPKSLVTLSPWVLLVSPLYFRFEKDAGDTYIRQ